MKKFITLTLSILMISSSFVACGKSNDKLPTTEPPEANNSNDNSVEVTTPQTIRFLNFKPEIATIYNEIAETYNEETGNTLIVETSSNNTYEQTLSAKMSTNEAPTIFQVNGIRGYSNWQDYCEDLTDTELYAHLTDKSLALSVDDKVYGIPYTVEGYGIIYNEAITEKYFSLDTKNTDFTSMEEINTFDKLKSLVEDMQLNADKLGIKGVFASTSLKSGDDWRWQTHLANIPIHYEFTKNNIDLTGNDTKTIDFEYSDNYKNIFDLYINNSTTDKKLLGSKIVDESMSEFALGECAMVQNGNWAWSQISSIQGNTVQADDIKYLPIYMGLKGEESQGLCVGTENFLCINSKASDEEKQVAKDFLFWLYSSEKGKEYVTNRLNFIAPFDTFSNDEKPSDPLSLEVLRWLDKEDINNIPWTFTIFPSQTFKDEFGSALLQYAQGNKDWDYVKSKVIDSWKSESEYLD